MLTYILLFVDYSKKRKKSKEHGRTVKNSEVCLTRNALKERGISESSRIRAIKELENLGYIERLPSKNCYEATRIRVLKGLWVNLIVSFWHTVSDSCWTTRLSSSGSFWPTRDSGVNVAKGSIDISYLQIVGNDCEYSRSGSFWTPSYNLYHTS